MTKMIPCHAHTPTYTNTKAHTNLNVFETFDGAKSSTQCLYFGHMCQVSHVRILYQTCFFFLGSCQSAAHCLEKHSKRLYCVSRRKSLEVRDEWGHQLNKPSVLSYCPRTTTLFPPHVSVSPAQNAHTATHS